LRALQRRDGLRSDDEITLDVGNAWCQCGHRPCCVRLVRRADVAVELGRWPETATLMWPASTLASRLKASSLIWLSDFIGLPLRRCAYPAFNVRPRRHAATSHVGVAIRVLDHQVALHHSTRRHAPAVRRPPPAQARRSGYREMAVHDIHVNPPGRGRRSAGAASTIPGVRHWRVPGLGL
jgi:hypothetical protein